MEVEKNKKQLSLPMFTFYHFTRTLNSFSTHHLGTCLCQSLQWALGTWKWASLGYTCVTQKCKCRITNTGWKVYNVELDTVPWEPRGRATSYTYFFSKWRQDKLRYLKLAQVTHRTWSFKLNSIVHILPAKAYNFKLSHF